MLSKYIKKYSFKSIAVLITCLLFISVFSIPVVADGDITITVDPGFNGEYKTVQWIPIHVTITNSSNKDIDGDIVIETKTGYEFAAQYYQPITIPKNSTKKTTLIVPGEGIFSRSNVKLIKDEKVLAKTYVGGRGYPADTYFIGVLANDKDTGNFLALVKNNNKGSTKIINLTDNDISTNSNSLSSLDVLLINNYSFDGLNEQQIESIVDWTKQGGSLILAGGANYNKADKALSSISPIDYTGTTEVTQLANLENEAGKPINLTAPFTLSNGNIKSGDILIEEAGVPVYVLNDVENGNVLYVAYDIAEEPLASWSGNADIWNTLLNQLDKNTTTIQQNYYNGNWWALRNASEKIPALELPELNQLAIFFIIYIIVIGPILYFVLKRRNKQDKAWLFIPIIALILTIGIYQLANFNRGNEVMTHNVSYLEFIEGEQAKLNSISAVFVPKAGDYKVKYQGDGTVRPLDNYDYYQNESNALVNYNKNETNITYKDVGYWSFKRSYIQNNIEDAGLIDSTLSYQDGKLVGTITNKTKYNLRDVKLLIANNVHEIGDMDINQSQSIDIPYTINTTYSPQRYNYNFERLLPTDLQQSNVNSFYTLREYNMLEVLNSNKTNSYISAPTLIAWSDDQIIDFEVVDKVQEDYNITLVKSNLNLIPAKDGYVFYPPDTYKALLIDNKANNLHESPDGYYFSAGELYFEFKIENEGLDIENIKFYIWSYDNYNFTKKIYNYELDEYVLFSDVMVNDQLDGKDAKDYISSNGRIKIEISHNENNNYNLQLPAISVEGRKN